MATTEQTLVQTPLEGLAKSVRGVVLQPGDEGYDEARKAWNGMFDRRPDVIVRCAGVADVIAAVRFARSQGMPIAVRGGGHSVPGYSTIEGGLLLDLSLMNHIRVDPQARIAWAEGGALWEDLDHETQAFGLAVTGGQVSHTGIAGLTLGGGFGYLVRKYGFTVDNLISADVVTCDGQLVHASETENPDLYWGIRGGGGNFGIVTSFEYRLHPVGPIVTGGLMLYPVEAATDMLRFIRDFMATAPDELTTQFIFLTAPPLPFVPEPVQGTKVVAIAVCYVGSPEQAAEVLAPLRAFRTPALDMVGPMPYTVLQQMINAGNPHGFRYYTKGHYLTELTDEAIDTIANIGPTAPSPMSILAIISLGGAAGRVLEEATAMGTRNALFSFDVIGAWADPATDAENIAWVRSVCDATEKYSSGTFYINLLGDDSHATVRNAYRPETYHRLAELKRKYDPDNFFRLNSNIEPAK